MYCDSFFVVFNEGSESEAILLKDNFDGFFSFVQKALLTLNFLFSFLWFLIQFSYVFILFYMYASCVDVMCRYSLYSYVRVQHDIYNIYG